MSWTVVIPYYNERAFLPATLASIRAQTRKPERLLLVDNASTDGSEDVARAALAGEMEIDVAYLHQPRPGKTRALAAAQCHLQTEFVAFCDADTYYPPHYLARAKALFARGGAGVVAVMAAGVSGAPDALHSRLYRLKTRLMSMLLARQTHTGGYGQMFRVRPFLEAGGFSPELWPYTMEDHEIMQRVFRLGHAATGYDLWCRPSDRRRCGPSVYWSLADRLLYHITPFAAKGWYFRDYLGPRLARRGLEITRLREQGWEGDALRAKDRAPR